MDILNLDALALSQALEHKQISAAELMQATLARIDAVNGTVNAIVSLRDADALMDEARAADRGPRRGWLHGIPMAIKDLAHARGLPTSMGSPLFAGQVAKEDEVMTARLRAAGALIIGKTNTPEFGLGSHTFNPVHGITRNPYGQDRSAGGSSGGAAAALAARMLAVADGSDMMGSLRNPAGWNNVYGMRPTWGLVPPEPGGDAYMHPLATSGPMARSPRDLAALLDVMAGPIAAQPLGRPQPPALPQMDVPLEGQRIAWLGDWGGALPMEEGILPLSTAALAQMADLGHQVTDLEAPYASDAIWNSWTKLRAFAVAAKLEPLYVNPQTRDHLKPAAQWEIETGLALSASDLHRASAQRSGWLEAALGLFEQYDVLALPSAQCWPFEAELIHPEEIAGTKMDTYHRWMQVVVPAGLLGLPVVNVPIGFGAGGLPAGLQLIGPHGSDARLLRLAESWHAATDWPNTRPPGL